MNPEAVLARLLPLAPRIGVTRLAVLTGLDVIGLPVAAAVRPNSRSIAVHQGKGASLAAAKVAALMEAMECACAERPDLPLRLGSAAELAEEGAETLDVRLLPRCRDGADPQAARLLWVEGRSLGSGCRVWVPRELVAADFVAPLAPGSLVFQATTNGLGAGVTEAQATLHGLCEAIERDAVALWHAAGEAAQDASVVDPASVDGPRSRAILALCAAAGVAVTLWDVTSDIGVPVFSALLDDPLGRIQPEIGAACHPDPDVALAGALAEAAQARLTTISGARDDMTEAFGAAAIRARSAAGAAWRDAPAARRFRSAVQTSEPLEAVLHGLDRAGFGDAACVTLTRADPGVPVVRVVVPGLEGPWTGGEGEYVPGARAKGVR